MNPFKNKEHTLKPFVFILTLLVLVSCHSNKNLSHSTGSGSGKKSTEINKLEKKYAALLNVTENKINNYQLYSFIDEWYGVPYKYGGKNKNGIDCSNFTSTLYKSIYNLSVSGSSASIFNQCKVISKKEIKEGDLLFFKINKNEISHIGIYLQNNKFVHATTKKGVMINDLDEEYYKKHFFKAARLK